MEQNQKTVQFHFADAAVAERFMKMLNRLQEAPTPFQERIAIWVEGSMFEEMEKGTVTDGVRWFQGDEYRIAFDYEEDEILDDYGRTVEVVDNSDRPDYQSPDQPPTTMDFGTMIGEPYFDDPDLYR